MSRRENIRFISIIFTLVALLLFLPVISIAGSLEPSGPPEATMKTLDQIPPTWSQKLQCDTTACPRFELVMNGDAVLDKETGLVWEKSPRNYQGDWWVAQWQCWASYTGGRRGWRLPTISELDSLYEHCDNWPYALPCGHPFINLKGGYWSSTTWFFDSNQAIYFHPVVTFEVTLKSTDVLYNWCVRGGTGSHYESD
jgi:hypothetical protein